MRLWTTHADSSMARSVSFRFHIATTPVGHIDNILRMPTGTPDADATQIP
jgi:hypothetical protein